MTLRTPGLLLVLVLVSVLVGAEVQSESGPDLDLGQDSSTGDEVLDPLSSWLIFRRSSHREQRQRQKSQKKLSKHGPPGPPGPPGPQGPPGAAAPPLPQQQQLLEELRGEIRGLAEGACLQCEAPPRVSVWFLSRLQSPVLVPRRTLLELQPFSQAHSSPAHTASSSSLSSGRFTAPVSGFYQLTSSLLIESGDRVQVRVRDHVRAAVCIQSLCSSNMSVASVMGVAAVGGTFSILLTGTLHLQAGDYVSVFVDNGTGSAITVLQHSLFSGLLLGI